jgi:hypothetical protein
MDSGLFTMAAAVLVSASLADRPANRINLGITTPWLEQS